MVIQPTQVQALRTLSERYAAIKAHGFSIDTRGVRPLLVRGQTAIEFSSFETAVRAAESVTNGQPSTEAASDTGRSLGHGGADSGSGPTA